MTGVTLSWRRHHPTVVSRSGKGRCGLVTSLASRGDRNVVRRFAQRRRAVMAGGASRRDPRMAELRSRKGRGRFVAQFARRRGRHMRGGLAPCRRPVMAGRTPRHDPRVIKRGPQERRGGLMAGLAGLRGRNVRGGLAPCRRPVMAGRTPRHDPRMIISVGHKHPIRCAHSMAGIARSSCRQVPGRLPLSLDTVVTSCTSTWPNSLMFEGCARPANRPMAAVTGHGRRNMSSRLPYRGSLVMAFGAGSRSDTVMRKKRGCPICRPVTAATVDRGR